MAAEYAPKSARASSESAFSGFTAKSAKLLARTLFRRMSSQGLETKHMLTVVNELLGILVDQRPAQAALKTGESP